MHFIVEHETVHERVNAITGDREFPGTDFWTWALVKASGEVIARHPQPFATEKAARSQIAEAKKSMKGAMRCKVVTVEE